MFDVKYLKTENASCIEIEQIEEFLFLIKEYLFGTSQHTFREELEFSSIHKALNYASECYDATEIEYNEFCELIAVETM